MPVNYKPNMTNLEQVKAYQFPKKALAEDRNFKLSYTFYSTNSKSGKTEHNHNKNYPTKEELIQAFKEMFKMIGKLIGSGDNITGNYSTVAYYYYEVQGKKISDNEHIVRNVIKSGDQINFN